MGLLLLHAVTLLVAFQVGLLSETDLTNLWKVLMELEGFSNRFLLAWKFDGLEKTNIFTHEPIELSNYLVIDAAAWKS